VAVGIVAAAAIAAIDIARLNAANRKIASATRNNLDGISLLSLFSFSHSLSLSFFSLSRLMSSLDNSYLF
jgi:hypothetical protein